ncbi:MAG: Rrf2 family transcriptional regulator [Rickettsiaceae bacterium]|nr:Rrf2 family transcriptional regulator [Rickettsiaceae bacterium]
MMLTTKGRYAVMALADIAIHSKNGPVRLAEVADRQNIALGYLEQIFAKLKSLSVVKALRGPNGGYILNIDASTIKISQIIDAVDEEIKITRCSDKDNGCVNKSVKCITHDLWHGLGSAIRHYLEDISIDDVIRGQVKDAG